MTNLLFVCTNNKHRSVTAADMLNGVKVKRGDPRWVAFDEAGTYTEEYEAKSAGLSPTCENPVTKELLEWADKVYCFEDRHRTKLRKRFKVRASNLSVPDEYDVNSEELKEVLRHRFLDSGLVTYK